MKKMEKVEMYWKKTLALIFLSIYYCGESVNKQRSQRDIHHNVVVLEGEDWKTSLGE
jgi:hypothetical protein